MSLLSTIRAADRSPLHRDRSAEDPQSPPTEHVEAELPLPRHLLISLAGITADVTSLQQRCVDAPQLHEALETILGRLDGLVDSIYQRAADAAVHHSAAPRHRSGLAADSLSDALADAPVDFADASNVARPPTRVERSLPGHPS